MLIALYIEQMKDSVQRLIVRERRVVDACVDKKLRIVITINFSPQPAQQAAGLTSCD